MRVRIFLNEALTARLTAIALAERRSVADQATVILEEALGLRPAGRRPHDGTAHDTDPAPTVKEETSEKTQ
jgi:hypothetical protein